MKASAEQSVHEEDFNYKVKEAFITGSEGKTRPLKGKQWHKACLSYPKQAHVQRDKFSPQPLQKLSQIVVKSKEFSIFNMWRSYIYTHSHLNNLHESAYIAKVEINNKGHIRLKWTKTPHTIMLQKKMLTTGFHRDISHGAIKDNNEWDAKANT